MRLPHPAWLALTILLAGCGGEPGSGGDAGPSAGGDGGGTAVDATPTAPVGDQVFATGVLHQVTIEVAAADLDTLDNDQTVRVPCTVTVDGATVAGAGCRKKGTSSVRPLSDKAGFTVKFDEFVPGARLDGLKMLAIDNAIQDPGLVSGHVAYEVFRRAGLPAPRTSHAVVTFNGTVKGVFVLEEATTPQYLAAHFGDGSGNLYEGPWDFAQGVAAADLKDEVEDLRSRADLEALSAVVLDSPDGEFEAAVRPLLDVDRFITNIAVELIACLWDNYAYIAWNYYLYDAPADHRFVMLPHGVNWPYYVADLDPLDLYTYPWGSQFPPGRLAERVRQVPALDAAFRAELARVAGDAWDVGVLRARIDAVDTILHAAPLPGAAGAELAGIERGLDEARDFVTARKAYLTTRLGL